MSLHVNLAASAGLDPQAAKIISALSLPFNARIADPATVRKAYAEKRKPYLWELDEVGVVEKLSTNRGLPVTLFRPLPNPARGAPSTFLFFHGGGWTLGDLDIYEPLVRRLSNTLNANIAWVSYRLAPEHPFPAPLEDALHASQWLITNAQELALNPQRIGVMGDSAGGNLAAVAALINRDGRYGARFFAQVLLYPCLDLTCAAPSHRKFAKGFLLTRELYNWYVKNYRGKTEASNWLLSPLLAEDVKGIAPAVILHAGFDPLRDEAIAYCARLRAAKVPVKELAFSDMIHGFMNMGRVLPQAGDAVNCIRSCLHTLLAPRLSPKPASDNA